MPGHPHSHEFGLMNVLKQASSVNVMFSTSMASSMNSKATGVVCSARDDRVYLRISASQHQALLVSVQASTIFNSGP